MVGLFLGVVVGVESVQVAGGRCRFVCEVWLVDELEGEGSQDFLRELPRFRLVVASCEGAVLLANSVLHRVHEVEVARQDDRLVLGWVELLPCLREKCLSRVFKIRP